MIHSIQNLRKEKQLKYNDRITLYIKTESQTLKQNIEDFGDLIKKEVLAKEISFQPIDTERPYSVKIEGEKAELALTTVS